MLVKKVLQKHSIVIFGLVCPLEKFDKLPVAQTLPFLFKICKYKKSLHEIHLISEVTGSQSKIKT